MTAYFGRATMAALTAGLAYMIYSNATSTPTDATDDAPTTTTTPSSTVEQQHDHLDTDLDEPPQLDAATIMELLEDTQQRHVDVMQASLDASTATAATLQRQLDASVNRLAHQALASLHESAAADEVIRNLQLELNAANVTVEVVTMDAARALDQWHRAVSSRLFECPRCGGIDDTPIMIESNDDDDDERWSCEDAMPMSAILAAPPQLPSITETPEELTDDDNTTYQQRRERKLSRLREVGLWPLGPKKKPKPPPRVPRLPAAHRPGLADILAGLGALGFGGSPL
ncbi:hypothetical protein SDRG_15171 [Saprolegnia diclina VS20]|uniref:Uncharacterized protein n=1 Tax=Saprolegnia diclina (strain VS20) TaxID=1156394 RepID=T0RBX3_SAPDV|nr:hypothetical protein SDRG_15171 [Saprolegnia diclina VS20]EQC27057.1 hypothetical protein SDRG_15171 [Saprolegnia diclina VS20]|eukprot:XP_008619557.1 hypothetical protein SDRG_15171 [Saprolegnia diclina VS20]